MPSGGSAAAGPARASRTEPGRRSEPPTAFVGEALVHVVRDDVEAPLLVLIDAVVARACPVAVAVDERHIQRQEPQRAVDVEDRIERGFQLVGRRLVQDTEQLDESRP